MDTLNIKDVSLAQLDETNNISVNLIDEEENQDHQSTPVFSQLGVACMPTSPTDKGACQALIAPTLLDGVIIGMHDSRTSNVYGNLKPGDTCIHSVDENQNAKILLKGDKKAITLQIKDEKSKKDMFVTLDGKNGKIQICGFKCILEMSENGIVLGTQGTGNSAIILNPNGQIIIKGKSILLGENACAATPICYSPAPVAGVSGVATPSLSIFVSP